MRNKKGRFGIFGGQYVPELLIPALNELEAEYEKAKKEDAFQKEFTGYLENYVGRPSLLYYAEHLTRRLGGAKIYLKREDLNHTGAHKINNTIGQVLLAKRMGKKRLIAETGAGQHGVATATVAALFGMECKVFMGEEDVRRQSLNVYRMKMLGTEVVVVKSGTRTLKDAMNEAMRYWASNIRDTFYVIGTVAGPHPYPAMVRDFQRVIGDETRRQMLEREGRLPDSLVACVGGGSNSLGLFYPFLDNESIKIYGAEAAGKGLKTTEHAATLTLGSRGVLHGTMSYVLQDEDGQVMPAYSVSAGLDYPGVGPEHAYLKETHRVHYEGITDDEALDAFYLLTRTEGIIPALESSHALAYAAKLAPVLSREHIMVVCLSGRGDKDVEQVVALREER